MTRNMGTDDALQTRTSDRPPEPSDPPKTFLFTQAPTSEIGRDACIDALTLHPPTMSNLLVVTHERSPDGWLETWRSHIGETPANQALVTVGSTTRSTAGRPHAGRGSSPHAGSTPGSSPGPQEVLSVSDPGDLTQLGIVVNERVANWRDNEHRTVVCGGSLTAMLQWVELPVLFRFLHVFLERLRAVDALVHFHLHPEAHSEQTTGTLEPLFDRVVDEPLNRARREDPPDLDADGLDSRVLRDLAGPSRRREVLRILLETGETGVRDLAVRLLDRENGVGGHGDTVSDISRERTSIDLHHNHLAKLDAAGLVEFDQSDHTVRLAADESVVRSYLDRLAELEES